MARVYCGELTYPLLAIDCLRVVLPNMITPFYIAARILSPTAPPSYIIEHLVASSKPLLLI